MEQIRGVWNNLDGLLKQNLLALKIEVAEALIALLLLQVCLSLVTWLLAPICVGIMCYASLVLIFRHFEIKIFSPRPELPKPKNILITGASSGLGAELAKQYAAEGVVLVLTGRDLDRLTSVVSECKAKGATVESCSLDVSDQAATIKCVTTMDDKYPFDLIIANAGTASVLLPKDSSFEHIQYTIFDTNLKGVMNTVFPLVERMKTRKNGQILLMSSLAGIGYMPNTPAYTATKTALVAFGRDLRDVLLPYNVHVSVCCPGFIRSAITESVMKRHGSRLPFFMETAPACQFICQQLADDVPYIVFPALAFFCVCFMQIPAFSLRQNFLFSAP